jgi:hypothetical protein
VLVRADERQVAAIEIARVVIGTIKHLEGYARARRCFCQRGPARRFAAQAQQCEAGAEPVEQ